VEDNKEHIAAALETLRPTSSWERATAAGQGVEGVSMGGRGFGVAMDALIKYLGPEYGVTFAMGTSFLFHGLLACCANYSNELDARVCVSALGVAFLLFSFL
jgi:hypothetical protein